MSRKSAPQIDIVKLEDKEDKLRAFMTANLDRLAVTGPLGEPEPAILMVARSFDSPVARAVLTLSRGGRLTRPVKAIFAMLDDAELEARLAGMSWLFPRRLGQDVRLLDAHEQLVLGPATSWIGDCMRRDPNKRDAYECYASDCARTAQWAEISFNRLWLTGAPRGSGSAWTDAVEPSLMCPPASSIEGDGVNAENGAADPRINSRG
ncbi:MAG: hypothetical protein AB7O43_02930 [Hyphomicrobiaceae bacterium]